VCLVDPVRERPAEIDHPEQEHEEQRHDDRKLGEGGSPFLLEPPSPIVLVSPNHRVTYGLETADMFVLTLLRTADKLPPSACKTPIVSSATSVRISAYSISA